MNPYEQSAAAGAAVLDEYKPGWVDKIDTSIINISNPTRCILGQVYAEESGDLTGYGYAFGWYPADNPNPLPASAEHLICFYVSDSEMRDAWIDLINKRREEVTA